MYDFPKLSYGIDVTVFPSLTNAGRGAPAVTSK
jgi:hypothetical protein